MTSSVYAHNDVNVVAVIGFGTMGLGIAQIFAENGFNVRVVDQTEDAITMGMAQLEANLDQCCEAGLVADPKAVLSRVSGYTNDRFEQATQGIQLAVETVPEVLEIKQAVFKRLDTLDSKVLIGSNTSSFTVTKMVAGMTTPQRVVGLHFFNPAHLIPAVEIHHGKDTDPNAIEALFEVMKRAGKKPVRVRKEVPGFIINRLTGALEREVDFLLDNGVVTPEDLDEAVKASFGFRLACLGPMEAEDFIGLDTAYRVSNNVYKDLSSATTASPGLKEKVDKGELGVKSGKGWYDYNDIPRSEVFANRDKKLLAQLALYRSMHNSKD